MVLPLNTRQHQQQQTQFNTKKGYCNCNNIINTNPKLCSNIYGRQQQRWQRHCNDDDHVIEDCAGPLTEKKISKNYVSFLFSVVVVVDAATVTTTATVAIVFVVMLWYFKAKIMWSIWCCYKWWLVVVVLIPLLLVLPRIYSCCGSCCNNVNGSIVAATTPATCKWMFLGIEICRTIFRRATI